MHLIVVALFVGCLRLAQWQWTVAVTPANPGDAAGLQIRNAFYAVQWVFFALFGVWFWGRFLRDQRVADDAYAERYWAEQAAVTADGTGVAGTDVAGTGVEGMGIAQVAAVERIAPTDNLSE
jgi:hypothetical protein